ncbi:MAG: FecR domain-containing protein [Methylococcaceae bacterium]
MSFLRVGRICLIGVVLMSLDGFIGSSVLAGDMIYKVQKGDNLWTVAQRHLTSLQYLQKLQAYNKIANPYRLEVGSNLLIPSEWLKSPSNSAQLSHIKGEVKVLESATGKTRSANTGEGLLINDEISVKSNSNATLELEDGSSMLLRSGSVLKIEEMENSNGKNKGSVKILLKKGSAEIKVKKKRKPSETNFEIRTPSATTAVRGTQYRVKVVGKDSDTQAEVVEGKVAVGSGGQTVIIPKGFGTIAKKGKPPVKPVKLLSAPSFIDPPDLFEASDITFELNHLDGATFYAAELSGDNGIGNILAEGQFATKSIKFPAIADGEYTIRVRGTDKNGFAGKNVQHTFVVNAIPKAPDLISPLNDGVIKESAQVFSWSAGTAKSTYFLQVADVDNFEKPILQQATISASNLQLEKPLENGVYYWRIATNGDDGKPGPFTQPVKFEIQEAFPYLAYIIAGSLVIVILLALVL